MSENETQPKGNMSSAPKDGTRVLFYFRDNGVAQDGRHLNEGWSIGSRDEDDKFWQFENLYFRGRDPNYWWPLERPN